MAVAIRTPARAAKGISETAPDEQQDDHQQDEGVNQGSQPGRGTASDVHGRPRDGSRRRDSAEEWTGDVGDALAEELAIGVVPI